MIEAFEGMRRASEVRRAEVKKSLWNNFTPVCGRKQDIWNKISVSLILSAESMGKSN